MDSSVRKEISKAILSNREDIARSVMEKHFMQSPSLAVLYDEKQKDLCLKDVNYNLSYLSQAIELGSPKLFHVYVTWLHNFLSNINVQIPEVIRSFSIMEAVLNERLPQEFTPLIREYMQIAYHILENINQPDSSFLSAQNPYSHTARLFLELILQGKRHEASKLVLDLATDKESIKSIYMDIFQPVQREIGRLWQIGKISVAQEHYCTSITQLVISQLYPYIFTAEEKHKTLVATCVSGELHEIGLRMLSDVFELEGWNTWYLGANMPHDAIVNTIIEKEADLIAISATMTFHLNHVTDLIRSIRKRGIKLPIMVGGYPFNADDTLWQKVGADASATDAVEALTIANGLAIAL
ncbi:MAG: cobalamin-dependent protein [Candidatus Cloacimonadaceae bacterium]|nr:cobalamin-dependent protein [Candidatus Cloacimonadaceae bacterium]